MNQEVAASAAAAAAAVARRNAGRATLRLLLLFSLLVALPWWTVLRGLTPGAELWDAPPAARFVLLGTTLPLFHLAALAIIVRLWRGTDLRRLAPPVGLLLLTGGVAGGLFRPAALPAALLAALTLWLVRRALVRHLDTLESVGLRRLLTATYLLSAYGVLVLGMVSPRALWEQLPLMAGAWILALAPPWRRLGIAVFRAFGAGANGAARRVRLAGALAALLRVSVLALLAWGVFRKVTGGGGFTTISLGGVDVQPADLPLLLFTLAAAIRLVVTGGVHRPRDWVAHLCFVGLLALLGETGTSALYLISVFLATGIETGSPLSASSRRFAGFWLAAAAAVLIAILLLPASPTSPTSPTPGASGPLGAFQNRTGHIRARLDHRLGKEPLAEMARTESAIPLCGWLGLGSGFDYRLLSPAATKDYMPLTIPVAVGLLGALELLVLYAAFVAALFGYGREVASRAAGALSSVPARGILTGLLTLSAARIVLPLVTGLGTLLPVGVTLPPISKGGWSAVLFVLIPAALVSLEAATRPGGVPPAREPADSADSADSAAAPTRDGLRFGVPALCVLAGLVVCVPILFAAARHRQGAAETRLSYRRLLRSQARWPAARRGPILDRHGAALAETVTAVPSGRPGHRIPSPRRHYPGGEALASLGLTDKGTTGVAAFQVNGDPESLTGSGTGAGSDARVGARDLLFGDRFLYTTRAPGLRLTVDAELSRRIYSDIFAGPGRAGCAILMDGRTGDVEALVSYPVYSRNGALEPNHALVPVQIGSTGKPLWFLGYREAFGQWPGGADVVEAADWREALAVSSNPTAERVVARLGADRLRRLIEERLRLEAGHPLPGLPSSAPPGSAAALWAAPDAFRAAALGRDLKVTPLALLTAYTAVFHDGVLTEPRLIAAVGDRPAAAARRARVFAPEICREMREALRGVTAPGGTAAVVADAGAPLIGKTGTIHLEGRGANSGLFVFSERGTDRVGIVVLRGGSGREYRGEDAARAATEIWALTRDLRRGQR